MSGNTAGARRACLLGDAHARGREQHHRSPRPGMRSRSRVLQQVVPQTAISGIWRAPEHDLHPGTVALTGGRRGVTVSLNTGQRVSSSRCRATVQPETQTPSPGSRQPARLYTSGTVSLCGHSARSPSARPGNRRDPSSPRRPRRQGCAGGSLGRRNPQATPLSTPARADDRRVGNGITDSRARQHGATKITLSGATQTGQTRELSRVHRRSTRRATRSPRGSRSRMSPGSRRLRALPAGASRWHDLGGANHANAGRRSLAGVSNEGTPSGNTTG